MKKSTIPLTFQLLLSPRRLHCSSTRPILYICFLLMAFLLRPLGIEAQIFDYRDCIQFLTPPESAATTLCDANSGFVPDLTIGTSQISNSFSSNLPLVTNSGGFNFLSNLDIQINGRLFVNESFSFINCNVRFGPGGHIVVLANRSLGGFATDFFACDVMWRGITAVNGATGLSLFACQIEDAQFAISLAEGVSLSMISNRLNRNHVGLRNGSASSTSPGLNVSFFFSNEFTCDEDLNQPYPGQDMTNLSEVSFAGMLLEGTTASFGFSFSSNRFSKMLYGIFMRDSDIAITRFRFEDMVTGSAGFAGAGIVAIGGSLLADGFGESFISCPIGGINASGTNLEVRSYTFSGVQENCIRSFNNTLAQNILIEKNTINVEATGMFARGINLSRSNASGSTFHNRIRNNTINVNGTFPATGIFVQRLGQASDNLSVEDNTIYVNNTGSNVRGIELIGGSTQNNQIIGNDIFYNSANVGTGRFGISTFMSSGSRNEIRDNVVVGNQNDINENRIQCAIHSSSSPGLFYCNNTVEDAARGFHFESNNDNSDFGGNTIMANDRGLFISSGQIGFQDRRGNTWSTNPNAFSVFAAENDDNVEFSRFDIHSTASQFDPPNIDPPNGWFFNVPEDLFPCEIRLANQSLSAYEEKVADGSIQAEGLSIAAIWDTERELFDKLMSDSEYAASSALAEQFVNERMGTNMEDFFKIGQNLRDILLPTEEVQTKLDEIYAKKQQVLQQLAAMDAQIVEPQEFSTDFDATFWAAKNVAFQDVLAIQEEEKAVREQVKSERNSSLEVLLVDNNGINTDGVHEKNLQKMNEMWIKIGMENVLDEDDLSTLLEIAQQSPEEGGKVVELARLLLPWCIAERYGLVYDESEIRERGHSHDHPKVSSKAKVYPNPAANHLNITFGAEVDGTLKLESTSGEVLQTQAVSGAASAKLELGELPAGIYLLSFPLPDGQRGAQKVIIQ